MKNFIFFLKNKLFRQRALAFFNEFSSNEKCSPAELNQINFKKRQTLVDFAYKNSKFYRFHFDSHNFHPTQLKSEEDWQKVPCLTKELIRKNLQDILIPSASKSVYISETGGSTGAPLKVYHDKRVPVETLSWRMYNWWNLSPACDKAMIWRIPQKKQSFFSNIKDILTWFPTKRIKLDASQLSDEQMQKFLRRFNKLKPDILLGYVGSLEQFALFLQKTQQKIRPPKLVFATSSPMTEILRNLFRQTFQAPLLDQYGSAEVMWIGSNCPHSQNIHLNSDARHIDILDQNDQILPPETFGAIAITDLLNFAFPIIKYKNDDRAKFINMPCKCGRPFPLLSPIQGRTHELLRFPDGSFITDVITFVFSPYIDYISQYRIVQRADFSIDLLIAFNPLLEKSTCEANLQKLPQDFSKVIKNAVPVRLSVVDNIPNERGKTREIISELIKS